MLSVSFSFIFILFSFSLAIQFFDHSVKNIIGDIAWTIVYLLLPIIAFAIPIILKHRKKLCFKKSILISSIFILLYAFIAFGTNYAVHSYLKDFTPAKWEKHQSERHYMLEDMVKEIHFIGMSKENVIDLLGQPNQLYADTDGADLLDYYVGSFSIDPTMLTFVFEDNKVVEIYEYTEFRTAKKYYIKTE